MIKSDRRGLLFLISLLVVISALIGFLADTEYSSDNINYPTDSTLHLNLSRHDEDVADAYALPSRKVETFCFDPNTADSTQLLRSDRQRLQASCTIHTHIKRLPSCLIFARSKKGQAAF